MILSFSLNILFGCNFPAPWRSSRRTSFFFLSPPGWLIRDVQFLAGYLPLFAPFVLAENNYSSLFPVFFVRPFELHLLISRDRFLVSTLLLSAQLPPFFKAFPLSLERKE